MKVFKFNRIIFTTLGVYPFHQIKKPFEKWVQKISFYFVFIVLVIFLWVHVAFIHQNFHSLSELPDDIIAFAAIVAWTALIGSYFGSIIMKKKVLDDLNNELQKIVDKGNSNNATI